MEMRLYEEFVNMWVWSIFDNIGKEVKFLPSTL